MTNPGVNNRCSLTVSVIVVAGSPYSMRSQPEVNSMMLNGTCGDQPPPCDSCMMADQKPVLEQIKVKSVLNRFIHLYRVHWLYIKISKKCLIYIFSFWAFYSHNPPFYHLRIFILSTYCHIECKFTLKTKNKVKK